MQDIVHKLGVNIQNATFVNVEHVLYGCGRVDFHPDPAYISDMVARAEWFVKDLSTEGGVLRASWW